MRLGRPNERKVAADEYYEQVATVALWTMIILVDISNTNCD